MNDTKTLCECGHPRACHHAENLPVVHREGYVGPCHATVYTHVSMGTNATRCGCKKWKEKR